MYDLEAGVEYFLKGIFTRFGKPFEIISRLRCKDLGIISIRLNTGCNEHVY